MSRLLINTTTVQNSVRYYTPTNYFMVSERNDDIYFRVTRGTRLDVIASKIYKDASLWWIIASTNNLDISDYCLSDDKVIRVPHPSRIQNILSDISNNQGA